MTPEIAEFFEDEWVRYFNEYAETAPLFELFNDFSNIYSANYDEYCDMLDIITAKQEEIQQEKLDNVTFKAAMEYSKKWEEHRADPENFLLEVETEMLARLVYELEHLNPHPYNFKYNTLYKNRNDYGNLQEKRF